MAMRTTSLIVCAFGFLLLAGCPGNDARVLFENAAYEESHMNYDNAKKIYEEIISRYPESKEADIARARLAELNSQKTQ